MAEAAVSTSAVTDAATDAIVVTAFEDTLAGAVAEVDTALGGVLGEMMSSEEWTGKFAQRPLLRTLGRMSARLVIPLGLGKPGELDGYRLHNAFHLAGRSLRAAGARSVTAYVDSAVPAAMSANNGAAEPAALARAVATGLLLGNWEGKTDKSKPDGPPKAIERIEVAGLGGGEEISSALREAAILAQATNQVRTWATMPSNTLTPTLLAGAARSLYQGTGLELEVLEKADLERLGMGALLGVARGSDEPPVMICVRWDGGAPDAPRLALVGKGITFDTGGISIKPANGMELMKYDMGGGAAVIGAMWAIAQLKLRANVIGVVPATENMPSGHAYKPGDVLHSRNGKTIEVTNTDAEGRIILADGLTQAKDMGATHIVDCATLTGAIVVALGHVATGMMGNDRALARMVADASARAGDRVVDLPMFPEYDVCLDSDVADMKNAAGRQAGSLAAGVFLREFVGDTPWVHLDIAGTGWNDQSDLGLVPSGPSGTPVRTFVELAREFEKLG
jgi:leucyl aminopeptidase